MKPVLAFFIGLSISAIGLIVPENFIGAYGALAWVIGILWGVYICGAF